MADIDPLSQLIGGLTAQVTALGSQLIDLRSEIVTNRSRSETRWDDLSKAMDQVHAEYRNVKHLERDAEQKEIALDALLKRMAERLGAIEDVVLVWRTRVTMLLAAVGVGGTVMGFMVEAGVSAAISHWWK